MEDRPVSHLQNVTCLRFFAFPIPYCTVCDPGCEARQHLMVSLRQKKKEIRAFALSWPDKKVLLSQAAAQSVLEIRALKLSVQQRRQEAFPKNLRSWVADRADEGDAHAAAQLRGWRYADQRNQRRLDARLESDALHIAPFTENGASADWSGFAQQRLADEQKQQILANQTAATRLWTINRKTGDVSYMVNGRVSVIDRGRIVTVLNQEEAAIVFGLEMAVQKYRIANCLYRNRPMEADGHNDCGQARHFRPIHRPGDARRPPPATTLCESSSTPCRAAPFD